MNTIIGSPITLGGGGLELVANVADGATVTATLGSKTVTGVSVGGQARLKIPNEGEWEVSATKGISFSVPQKINVPATVNIAFVAQELNDASWEVIKQVADASMGANYWAIGDCKKVTMNGKVSSGLTLTNYPAWVYIIGFNHNAEREGNGIAFQGFKVSKNGTDVCLVDSGYNSVHSSGTWFNINNVNNNTGGWEACLMRKNIMPKIKASFPADLKAVIKPSTIFTTQGSGSGACTATEDDIFLLAEYEVFGARTNASSQEPNYLKQYSYYSAGNSKVKRMHNSADTTAIWWLRSPSSNNSNSFCRVTGNGRTSTNSVASSYGVSPCFNV